MRKAALVALVLSGCAYSAPSIKSKECEDGTCIMVYAEPYMQACVLQEVSAGKDETTVRLPRKRITDVYLTCFARVTKE